MNRSVPNKDPSTLGWPRWALDLVSAPMRARPVSVLSWVAVMVVAFTAITYIGGGTASLPPHWFYIPIVVAGARFGVIGAVAVAVVSGLAVGPSMPADVVAGTAQETSDWLTRSLFFVVVGSVVAGIVRQAARGIERERHQLASARRLDVAMQQGQLQLHFQPIVSASSGEISGVEALLRWETPDRGLISPEMFVPAAEENGQIVAIGGWVIEEACSQLENWSNRFGGAPVVMSVNVAAAQLESGDLVSRVYDALDRHSLEPSALCLEITESSLIPDMEASVEVLAALRDIGVSIAIDDFGTGQSSLSYIRSIPFDTLKIDGRFLEELGERHEADTLVDSIVKLGNDLDKTTVAEMVETELQWERVVASGCTHGQGYLFAPPLPPGAFLTLLASRQAWPSDNFRATN